MKNFSTITLGCQQNEFDSARMSFILKSLGLNETTKEDADVLIVLSCAVRQTAVDRIFGLIKNNPGKKIFVTGCVIESDKKKLQKLNVDFFSNENIQELLSKINIKADRLNTIEEASRQTSSFIPIMTGCDNFCSYCAVPYTRGREKSRDIGLIINEAEHLIKNQKAKTEITLLGQNVNSFTIDKKTKDKLIRENLDFSKKKDFSILLELLNRIPGDYLIGFISNHPKDMSDDIIEAVARLKNIKKEIHLPLQSGSNKILKLMNRPYTIEDYLKIIEKIKKTAQKFNTKISITTDIIVGFPKETEDDFEKTVQAFRKIGFSMAYINKYSPRAGTAAFKLGDPISWKEKQRRWHILDNELKKASTKIS